MTEQELKSKLQQKYNHSIWKDILNSIFPKVEYLLHSVILAEKTETAKLVRQIGNLKIADGTIGIFEVEVSSRKKIARNRVELRKIAASYIDQNIINGAFVFYFASNQNDYRFTFIAKKSNLTEEGELVKYQTSPKRYTYVLGPNESCTTAAKRLLELEKKNSPLEKSGSVSLDDIIQAFSIEKLNKEFFKKYKEHYEAFCDYLAASTYRKSVFNIPHLRDKKENSKAEKPIRDFIKLLLGRIVFLHFLQKKGWIGCPAHLEDWKDGDSNFMQNLFLNFQSKQHFHSKCLIELFFDTLNNNKRKNNIFHITNSRVPYLNGGLFDDTHPECSKIDFPKKLFENLFDFFSQYNFTIDESSPDEHEVGIDPEMLGHIFENLLEDNKDKGAFYTPKEIVHYMCHESLIQYLKTNISNRAELRSEEQSQDIENFIHTQEVSAFIRDHSKEIDSLLDKVKICDPAIGSGAFPMGLLKEIFQAKLMLYPYLKTNRSFNPGAVKRNIIQNSIYGVDIDSGAIDIARLRFWLALIVDEEEPTPLPNLDYKIMQGNSLLESFEGIDLSTVTKPDSFKVVVHDTQLRLDGSYEDGQSQIIFTDNEKENLSGLMNQYFTISERKEKDKLHKQIDKIVLDSIHRILDKHRLNLESALLEYQEKIKTFEKYGSKSGGLQIKKLRAKDYESIDQLEKQIQEVDNKFEKLSELYSTPERPFFLWHLYFQDVFDDGGFDIVIGNPPYVGQKGNKILFEAYVNDPNFEKKMDYWFFFLHISFYLLAKQGVLTFITPNYWITAQGGKKVRQRFINDFSVIDYINFNQNRIFDAGVHTNIFVIKKGFEQNNYFNVTLYQNVYEQNILSRRDKELNFKCNQDNVYNEWTGFLHFTPFKEAMILSKLCESSEKLSDNDSQGEPDEGFTPGKKVTDGICNINQGIISGKDRLKDKASKKDQGVFILNSYEINNLSLTHKEKKFVKRFYKNSEIKKFVLNDTLDSFIIYIDQIESEKELKELPNIYKHFSSLKWAIKDRYINGVLESAYKKGKWWALIHTTPSQIITNPKIVCPQRSISNTFAYSEGEFYASADVYYISLNKTNYSIKYILALLNSRLIYFWLYWMGKRKGEYLELYFEPLQFIPIKSISLENQSKFEVAINKLIANKKTNYDTTQLENDIDIMIYKLYNLTYEEVKVIDPNIEQITSKVQYERFQISYWEINACKRYF